MPELKLLVDSDALEELEELVEESTPPPFVIRMRAAEFAGLNP